MADTMTAGTTVTTPNTPAWYDTLSQNFGGQIQGGLDLAQNLSGNWYNQPLTAGLTGQQTNLINQAPGVAGQWQPQHQAGLNQVQQSSQWNPAMMQQHMNPYVGGVLDEIARRGNQNLTEKILPNVNRTFTGAGLFGSAGNADFNNRAIRDTQGEILGAQSNAGLQAYNQASQDYYNWGQLGTQGGGAQMTGALAGQGQAWTDLEKQYALQEQQRQNTQQGLTAGYDDWKAQLSTPLNMMGALSQMMPQSSQLYSGAKTQVSAPAANQNNAMNDLLLILAAMGNSGPT